MKLKKRALETGGIILLIILVLLVVGGIVFTSFFIYGYYTPTEEGTPMLSTTVINIPFSARSSEIATSGIKLYLQNDFLDTVIITNFKIDGCGETTLGEMDSGSNKTVEINCNLRKGSNFRGDIEITYTKVNSQILQKSTGRIAGRVN